MATLDAEVEAAARELKRTPDDLYDLAIAELRRLRAERDAAVDALNALEGRERAGDLNADARVQAALEHAKRLRELLGSSDPRKVRHALGVLVDRVDLFFQPYPGPKITRSALSKGLVRFQKGSQLLVPASRPG